MTAALRQEIKTVPGFPSSGAALTTHTLDANNDALEIIFQPIDNITITRLGIRLSAITGTSPTFRISLQGVDGSGNPDGTVKGGGSPASKTFNPSSLSWASGTWHWLTLDNSYACAAGEFLALVVDYSSGTIDSSNKITISFATSSISPLKFPYSIQNNAGVRARDTFSGGIIFGYASASAAYGLPLKTVNSHSFQVASSPDEYALKFSFPAAIFSSYQLLGVSMIGALAAGSSNVLNLYSGTTTSAADSVGATTEKTVQQSLTIDGDYVSSASTGSFELYFALDNLVTLYGDAVYRLGVQPQGSGSVGLISNDVDAASDFDAWPCGQNVSHSTRIDAGNWTDTATRRLLISLILADITQPSGGGGTTIVRQRVYG